MNTPLYIFDLDGTLADLTHRRHLVALQPGSRVTVDGKPAIYRGPNPKIEGDYWIEFPETKTGWWSYHPNDVKFKPNWPRATSAAAQTTSRVSARTAASASQE